MKSIKMLGLAALAALMAMAFVGAPSAMAEDTALCKEDTALVIEKVYVETHPCPEAQRISHVHEETLEGKLATLLSTLDTVLCGILFLGDVTSAKNLGNPLEILGHFTYFNCKDHESRTCEAKEISEHAIIKVLRLGHELADITYSYERLMNCGIFIHCVYNGVGLTGHGLGPLLSEEENGGVKLEEQATNKVSGFLCPKTAKLDFLPTPLEPVYIAK